MSTFKRLRQRLAAEQAVCYLCRMRTASIEVLIHSIQMGPGRIMWDKDRHPFPLCPYHQRCKELRIDERQDRLLAAGYVVRFANPQRGELGDVMKIAPVSLVKES